MLRRKLSAGALRAAANPLHSVSSSVSGSLVAGAHAAAKPAQQQSANLASAVLLNSQRRWRDETIVTLRAELKRRGLSQVGNKSSLITRLESADTSSFLPPVPPLPKSATLKATGKRSISTTRPASLPPKSGSASKPPKASSPTTPAGADQAPIAGETVTSTGPALEAQKMEAPKTEAIEPETVTSAPGLPETATVPRNASDGMSMKMPESVSEPEIEQVIPLEPDNFRSNQTLPTNEPKALDPTLPKVMTVSAEETLPGGGPSHAIHDDHVPSASDKAESAAQASKEAVSEIASKIPGLGAAVGNAFAAPGRALSDVTGLLPTIGSPKGSASQKQYKASSEKLDGEEKAGAYILGGIVALGLFLGGSGGKKGKKTGHGGEHVAGGAGSGVKGDENWSKASGAGIVGHGSRKA